MVRELPNILHPNAEHILERTAGAQDAALAHG